jgi:hypothetical protein
MLALPTLTVVAASMRFGKSLNPSQPDWRVRTIKERLLAIRFLADAEHGAEWQ